jgi:pre-mRNA-splicing helicase BRR2
MAEREALQKRYAYSEMSNKVQRASHRGPRTTDATGEVESLWNVLPADAVGRMGDRVSDPSSGGLDTNNNKERLRNVEVSEMMERAAKRRKKKEASSNSGGRGNDIFNSSKSILEETIKVYTPTNPTSREAHSTLLEILSTKEYLGSQPREVLMSAAEEVLAILKDEHVKDPMRKVELGKLLTGKPNMNDGVYNKLVLLGREMDDYLEYRDRNSKVDSNEDGGKDGEEVDDEMGVAVVFDDSEGDNEEDSDVEEDVVRYFHFVLLFLSLHTLT